MEATVAAALGLAPADVATQVVLRDGIAEWVAALAIMATVCEAIALEVRRRPAHRGAGAVRGFPRRPEGPSAMPHKNPILSERIAGLARVVRGYVTPVTEGIPLWHERDISTSVERVALPDAAIATDYLLRLTRRLVDGLVDADRMRANLESTGGLVFTSAVLLDLVRSGLSREDAYALVQAAAMETWACWPAVPGGAARARGQGRRRAGRSRAGRGDAPGAAWPASAPSSNRLVALS